MSKLSSLLWRIKLLTEKHKVLSTNPIKLHDLSHLFFLHCGAAAFLLVVMIIPIIIALTVDGLDANRYTRSAWVFCSAGVSLHAVFSPAKRPSLAVIGRGCL